jgi:predicted nucleotidyltransferase
MRKNHCSAVTDCDTFDRHFMDVSLLLDDILGRSVDLVTLESLSPYIGPRILREVERVAIPA